MNVCNDINSSSHNNEKQEMMKADSPINSNFDDDHESRLSSIDEFKEVK